MAVLTTEHCRRAILDVVEFGDNDVVPFDVDTKFVGDRRDQLARALVDFGTGLERKEGKDCKSTLNKVNIFSERLLAPAGSSGFRIITKIHPFWNLYLNSLAVALAELHEPHRDSRTHSYRFASSGPALFDRAASWKEFRKASAADCDENGAQFVVQSDISSFYDHVYHHRLENFIQDLIPQGSNIATQVDSILNKLSVGRSFGLPVGGQASRVLAEILLGSIDRTLNAERIRWRRYVDDFVLLADSQQDAYRALGTLAHALGDLGLSLNRTKTNVLSSRHYANYVETQLSAADGEARRLKELDLHFDPYSDTADEDYEDLRRTIQQMDIARLIALELDKGQPDSIVVRQVSRSLALLEPRNALGICLSLLEQENIHAFRANWSTIMRGIAHVRGEARHAEIHDQLDGLLDSVPAQAAHLVEVDTNVLHYLRTVRFRRSEKRATFVLGLFRRTRSATVRRACIDCWRHWRDRERFLALRNEWTSLSPGEQRMLWLAAPAFGDDGTKFQKQVAGTIDHLWGLGLQMKGPDPFVDLFVDWAAEDASAI